MFSESLPPGARPPGLAAGEEAVPLGDTPRHLDGVSVLDPVRMANAAPLSSFDSRRARQSRGARSHLHLQQLRSQREEDRVLRTSLRQRRRPRRLCAVDTAEKLASSTRSATETRISLKRDLTHPRAPLTLYIVVDIVRAVKVVFYRTAGGASPVERSLETAESRFRDVTGKKPSGADGVDMKKNKKKNPHIGRRLDEFIAEQRTKDPEFRAEFDRLRLARKVKGLREKKKMSQLRLAALAGTKQPNIARLESGKVIPKLDFLEKVARALGGRLDVRIVEGK